MQWNDYETVIYYGHVKEKKERKEEEIPSNLTIHKPLSPITAYRNFERFHPLLDGNMWNNHVMITTVGNRKRKIRIQFIPTFMKLFHFMRIIIYERSLYAPKN